MSLLGNLGNFLGLGGGKPNGGDGAISDHSVKEGDDLLRSSQQSRLSGNIHRPATAPNIGNFQKVQDRINAQARLNPKSRTAKMEENALKRAASGGKYYVHGSEQLKKIAPELASAWKKAMPDSFVSSDKAKGTMARILGGKGDSWVSGQKMRDIQKAVQEGRWNHPSLSGFKAEEIKTLRNDSGKRREFVSGIKSLNPKKFY